MATHSSILAWRIPWIEQPGRLQSMGPQVQTRPSKFHVSLGFSGASDGKESACSMEKLCSVPGSGRSLGEGNGNPLQYSCLENPMDGGAWWATVHGVSKSQTRLSTHAHARGCARTRAHTHTHTHTHIKLGRNRNCIMT